MTKQTQIQPRRKLLRDRNASQNYGYEKADPQPHAGYMARPEVLTLREEMQRFIRGELSARAAADDFESFEEADNFDLPEEDEQERDFETAYTVRELTPELGRFDDLEGDPQADVAQIPGRGAESASEPVSGVPPTQGPLTQEQISQLISFLQNESTRRLADGVSES